jgi:pilus assembly protein CpaB
MGRRTLLLIAALAVAAVGTSMVFLYVNGVNTRALDNQEPVRVLVAKTQISAGTSVTDAQAAAAFDVKEISRDSAAPGALSDLAPIEKFVALSTIFPGEQILVAKFGPPGSTNTLPVPDGKLAISVQLDDPARVSGYVSAGSKVAVFVTIENKGGEKSRLLLPEVEVIAAGGTTLVPSATSDSGETGDTASADQVPKALVTLAVDQEEYQKVFYASTHGQLYFAMIGKDGKPSTTVPGTDIDNLFEN